MWKRRFKNSAVRIARSLGFMDDKQAKEADKILEDNPDDTSQDLLVGADLLTESQAKVVTLKQKEEDPNKHLHERIKKAVSTQHDLTATGLRAISIQGQLAKKTGTSE